MNLICKKKFNQLMLKKPYLSQSPLIKDFAEVKTLMLLEMLKIQSKITEKLIKSWLSEKKELMA